MALRYPLTHSQKKALKQAFIDSIDSDAVLRLASRHRQGKLCRFFRESSNGSFNVCFFVEFLDDDSIKWILRFPIVPVIHGVWEKLQSEIATMRYIEENTTIPIPHIHAFGPSQDADEDNPTGLAYLLLDFIPGNPLDLWSFYRDTEGKKKATPAQKERFYSQLVHIHAQLRQLEFDEAGSLMPDPQGGSKPIVGPMLCIPLNELQFAQISQGDVAPTPASKFSSVIDFAFYHYHILRQLHDIPVERMTQQWARKETWVFNDLPGCLFAHVDPSLNRGPFVLSHSDLRWPNLIVDDEFNIQGVIDWEWAHTIPVQYFVPPYWLGPVRLELPTYSPWDKEYAEFRRILVDEAAHSPPCARLAQDWPETFPEVDMAIALIFRHYNSVIDLFFGGHVSSRIRDHGKYTSDAIKNYFDPLGEEEGLGKEVQQRLRRSELYTKYLKENGLLEEDEGPQGEFKGGQINDTEGDKIKKINAKISELYTEFLKKKDVLEEDEEPQGESKGGQINESEGGKISNYSQTNDTEGYKSEANEKTSDDVKSDSLNTDGDKVVNNGTKTTVST